MRAVGGGRSTLRGKKTPTISMVLEHLRERQAAEIEEERERHAKYEKRMERWDRNRSSKKPEEPEPAMRFVVSDTTTEALLSVHARSPLGLLLHRDELAGLLRGVQSIQERREGQRRPDVDRDAPGQSLPHRS